jgi:hypothetical protein
MDKNKIVFGSIAMDLKRVSLGFYRGSNVVANRFAKEALKRRSEIDLKTVKPYIKKLFAKIEKCISYKDKQKSAEDLLVYSTLFQNAALK